MILHCTMIQITSDLIYTKIYQEVIRMLIRSHIQFSRSISLNLRYIFWWVSYLLGISCGMVECLPEIYLYKRLRSFSLSQRRVQQTSLPRDSLQIVSWRSGANLWLDDICQLDWSAGFMSTFCPSYIYPNSAWESGGGCK